MKANFPVHAIHTDLWQDSLPSTDFRGFTLIPCISSSSVPCSPPCYHPLACSHPVLCSSPCAPSHGTCMASSCAFPQSHNLQLNTHLATPPGPPPQSVCSFCWIQHDTCCLLKLLTMFVSQLEPVGSQAMVVPCPFRASSQEEDGNDPS